MPKLRAVALSMMIPLTLSLGMQTLLQLLVALRMTMRHDSREVAQAILLGDPFTLGFVQLLAASAVLLLMRNADPTRDTRTQLALVPVSNKTLVLAFAAGPPLQVLLSETENVVRMFAPTPQSVLLMQKAMLENEAPLHRVGLVFAIGAVAPVTEEILFRAGIFARLREEFPRIVAVLISSVLFGAVHGFVVAPMVYAFIGGVLLALLFDRTRSVFATIALHAGVNITPLLMPSRWVHVPGMNGYSLEVTHVPWPLVVASTLALAACFRAIWKATGESEDA